jgi:hypothetical protein
MDLVYNQRLMTWYLSTVYIQSPEFRGSQEAQQGILVVVEMT